MKIIRLLFFLFIISSSVFGADFTVASYNCGALADHYDYIRAVCMQGLIQERYNTEPEIMAQLEKIQNTALRMLFDNDIEAQRQWDDNHYTEMLEHIISHPCQPESINKIWRQKSEQIVSPYDVRPIEIYDAEVYEILSDHMRDLIGYLRIDGNLNKWLDQVRRIMAVRIFRYQMKYDIICLQEADYLDNSVFPESYDVVFDQKSHSVNGIAWNKERFELIQVVGDITKQGFGILFRDRISDARVVVASGHLKGCNPFVGGADSIDGDQGLQTIIQTLESCDADIKIIGMDSNVTGTHPRLNFLKDADYLIDSKNYLEPTCTSPWHVLNTRIDWIAVKNARIFNVPVQSVGLNELRTNISDHKPIASKIYID